MPFSERWRPYIVLLIGVAAVSTASLFIRLAQADGMSSLVIASWRLGLAALLLTPLVLTRYRADLRRLAREEIGLALLAGVLLGIHFATWITSLEYTSVIGSVVLVSTNPLFVALAAPFLLRERLGRLTLLGIFLAIIGGVLVSASGDTGSAPIRNAPLLGDVLALSGAVAVAGVFIIGRRLRAKLAVVPYIWLIYGTAAVVLLAASVLTGQTTLGFAPTTYLWVILLALVPQLIGHTSYNYALGFLSAAYVSLTVLGEPVGSTLLAVLLLGERPQPLQLVGGLFILAALLVASQEEASRAQREAALEATTLAAGD